MFRRIFTAEERAAIKKYLAAKNGEREQRVRNIVYESKKHLPTIEADLVLLRKLLDKYKR